MSCLESAFLHFCLYFKMKSLIYLTLLTFFQFSSGNFNGTDRNEKILSRKRRYLVFPEGSSLQLVYCLTMPSLGMGKIFTIGSTAAMAWILPHEPMVFLNKKKNDKDAQMPHFIENTDTSDHNDIYEMSIMPNHPYSEFSHQGITDDDKKYYDFENYDRNGRPEKGFYPKQILGQHWIEPEHWHIYRRSRRSLYGKLEKLLNALSKDGRACILKLICQVSQIANRKGSFMEEIVKVIFRIKTHEMMVNEDVYDEASNKNHNCAERYKSCSENFFGK